MEEEIIIPNFDIENQKHGEYCTYMSPCSGAKLTSDTLQKWYWYLEKCLNDYDNTTKKIVDKHVEACFDKYYTECPTFVLDSTTGTTSNIFFEYYSISEKDISEKDISEKDISEKDISEKKLEDIILETKTYKFLDI